ncbi:hypothetical protein MWU59_07760 [Flavobacteriaceae bacterium F08102]|nr:hypothetical protein [Flavobacteriaceae bacterium F08102]
MPNFKDYQTDTLQQIDSIKTSLPDTFKAVKLIPAQKISNNDGAIIPSEAILMKKLTPAVHSHDIQDIHTPNYYLIGGISLATILIIVLILRKYTKKSKR